MTGEAPELPANVARFLVQLEDATDEWTNAQCPAVPLAMSTPMPLRGNSDQLHATTVGAAQPKTSTTPSARSVAGNQTSLDGLPHWMW